jgi:hypothetical protein
MWLIEKEATEELRITNDKLRMTNDELRMNGTVSFVIAVVAMLFLGPPQGKAGRADVNLLQGKFFMQLFGLRANYSFSPNVSWANLVQSDNESRVLGLQSRFRWILKPGNDLFLVLNRGWYRTFERDYVSTFDRGTIELQYTFRF